MKRETLDSRSGAPTIRVDGIFLHSRYDPLREASRHAEQLNLTARTPRAVVVIGEGIPYLSNIIAAQHAGVVVCAAVLGAVSSEYEHEHEVVQVDATSLNPGDLRRWLRSRLSPLDAAALELVTWEPARRLAPAVIANAEEEVLEVVKNASAEIATIGSFGRRWLSNSIRSAIQVGHRWDIPSSGTTATLATSGPSLERLLPTGREAFPGILAATSSAWKSLKAFGIDPEVVVHTDGGYWASRYLKPMFDCYLTARPVVAMPAHAAVPGAILRSPDTAPFSFLSTGWLGEQLHADFREWQRVPEAPTVTATALHLLHGLFPEGQIYLAGLDLISRGLLSHARPHPNDLLFATWAHRLRPELSIRAERILGATVTTQTWADDVIGYRSPALEAFLPEINRILATHRTTGSVASLGKTEKEALPQSRSDQQHLMPAQTAPCASPVQRKRPSRADRVDHVRRILRTWRGAAVVGPWDENQREILFHLAPVEVLQTLRGELDGEVAAASARTTLDTLTAMTERISLQ